MYELDEEKYDELLDELLELDELDDDEWDELDELDDELLDEDDECMANWAPVQHVAFRFASTSWHPVAVAPWGTERHKWRQSASVQVTLLSARYVPVGHSKQSESLL